MDSLFLKIVKSKGGCLALVILVIPAFIAVIWSGFRLYDKIVDVRHKAYLNTIRFGYIDKTGNLIIPCQFVKASIFKNGVAYVQSEPDSECFYIDTLGNKISGNGLPVLIPDFEYETKRGKHYPKNTEQYRQEPNPAYPNAPSESDFVKDYTGKKELIEPFSENIGLSRVFHRHLLYPKYHIIFLWFRYGFQDTTGTLIIPANYYDAKSFHEGLAAVQDTLEKDKSLWGYINPTANYVIKPNYI